MDIQKQRFKYEQNLCSNLIQRLDNIDTTLNQNVVRTDTKALQTLTSAQANDNKTGLSVIASSIVFGSDAINDGSRTGQVSGITFQRWN